MKLPSKPCVHCGRSMAWRKRWAKNWDEIKFCSERCRKEVRGKRGPQSDSDLERAILSMLAKRARDASICPSEVLPPELKTDKQRMELVRQAARRLQRQGLVDIVQGGQIVDPDVFRGPIRVRLRNSSSD